MTPSELKTARLNAGFSIKSLARELEIHEHAIRKLEDERGGVHPSTAKKIADFFGVKVTDLPGMGVGEIAA